MATYRRREEVEAVEAQRPGMLTTPDGPAAYLPGGFHNYDAPRGKLRDEAAGISLEVRPRHAAGGQVSANFDAAMQADAAAILGADGEFAEAVTYKPRHGATRAIYASVIRNPLATPQELRSEKVPALHITVQNSATTGISSAELDTGGDRIALKLKLGDTADTDILLTALDSQDAAVLTFRIGKR
jgi:hypothetical protein